jgi:hypothetical protein
MRMTASERCSCSHSKQVISGQRQQGRAWRDSCRSSARSMPSCARCRASRSSYSACNSRVQVQGSVYMRTIWVRSVNDDFGLQSWATLHAAAMCTAKRDDALRPASLSAMGTHRACDNSAAQGPPDLRSARAHSAAGRLDSLAHKQAAHQI